MRNEQKRQFDWTDSINAAKKGDEAAFRFIYENSYGVFLTKAEEILQSEQDAQDAVQNAYVKMFQSLNSLSNPNAFIAWGRSITTNSCIDLFRSRRRVSAHEMQMPATGDEDVMGMEDIPAAEYRREFSPEQSMDINETQRLVRLMLADLPDQQRAALVMWSDNLTYREIGERLGIPEGTAKSSVFLGRKKIKAKTERLEREQGINLRGVAPVAFFVGLMSMLSAEEVSAHPLSPQMAEAGEADLIRRISQISVRPPAPKNQSTMLQHGLRQGGNTRNFSDPALQEDPGQGYAGQDCARQNTAENPGTGKHTDGQPQNRKKRGRRYVRNESGAAGARVNVAGPAVRRTVAIIAAAVIGTTGGVIVGNKVKDRTGATGDVMNPRNASKTEMADSTVDSQSSADSVVTAGAGNAAAEGQKTLTITLTTDATTHYDEYTEGDVGTNGFYSYQKIECSESEEFPALARRINEINTETKAECDGAYSNYVNDMHLTYWKYFEEKASLLRGDSRVFSLYTYTDRHTDAAGISSHFYNIDTQSGADIALSDVVSDMDSLAGDICEAASKLEESGWYSFDISESEVQSLIDNGSLLWGIGNEGLTIANFNQEILIPFDMFPGLLDTSWQTDAEQYGYKMIPDYIYHEYLDGDGTKESISAAVNQTDSGEQHVVINIEDSASTFLLSPSYALIYEDMYFCHAETGKSCILIQLGGDGHAAQVAVYEVSGGGVSYAGEVPGQMDNLSGEAFFANPGHFKMTDYTNLLGFYEIARWYHIGSSGLPEPDTKDYSCEGFDCWLYTQRDVPAEQISSEPEGVSTGNTVIPSGIILNFLRTDNESYVDVRDKSGNIYRVHVESNEDGTFTIGGVDENDYFYGIKSYWA